MKKWNNPELKNLSLHATNDEGVCPNENEAAALASPLTLFPEYVWGDGKLGCTHWNCEKHGCEHPNYGKKGMCWPCPPVKETAPSQS